MRAFRKDVGTLSWVLSRIADMVVGKFDGLFVERREERLCKSYFRHGVFEETSVQGIVFGEERQVERAGRVVAEWQGSSVG